MLTIPTRAEAEAWVAEVRERARRGAQGIPVRRPAPLLGNAAREFLRRAKAGTALTGARRPYAPSTLNGYESALRRHVLPHHDERHGDALANLPADTLDTRVLQAMVNALTAAASPALARVADAAIVAVLRDLYERGLLDALPARPVLPPPPAGRTERLSLAQVNTLLAAARTDDERTGRSLMEPLLHLLAGGGLRVSEALALTWGPEGVDLEADPPRVTVGRAATKTDAGARTIGLGREEAAALRRHRLATGRPPDGAPVFVDDEGRPLSRDGRMRSGLRRIAQAAGVPAGFHLLRHTHGSLLADAGQGGHAIAARLGHRDPAFTARRYVHADRQRLADAPAALEALRGRERAG